MRGIELGILIRGIIVNVNLFISSKVENHGFKHCQYEYFLHIFSSPDINQMELARLKNVEKASVTKALKIVDDLMDVKTKTI